MCTQNANDCSFQEGRVNISEVRFTVTVKHNADILTEIFGHFYRPKATLYVLPLTEMGDKSNMRLERFDFFLGLNVMFYQYI